MYLEFQSHDMLTMRRPEFLTTWPHHNDLLSLNVSDYFLYDCIDLQKCTYYSKLER